jgi:heme/copper-type cytochrome/quinol oxidase subunit 2
VRYRDLEPSRMLVTANEMHIPVGRPVAIYGSSHDVIHSFWVPNLHGKRDLIPGTHHSSMVRGRPARQIPRSMRRVLRNAARKHGDVGSRR